MPDGLQGARGTPNPLPRDGNDAEPTQPRRTATGLQRQSCGRPRGPAMQAAPGCRQVPPAQTLTPVPRNRPKPAASGPARVTPPTNCSVNDRPNSNNTKSACGCRSAGPSMALKVFDYNRVSQNQEKEKPPKDDKTDTVERIAGGNGVRKAFARFSSGSQSRASGRSTGRVGRRAISWHIIARTPAHARHLAAVRAIPGPRSAPCCRHYRRKPDARRRRLDEAQVMRIMAEP